MGAFYGYSLLWLVVVAIFFMAIFTGYGYTHRSRNRAIAAGDGSAKMGQSWRLSAMGIGVFSGCVVISGRVTPVGVGIAAGELFHTSPVPWILFFNALAICLLFFQEFLFGAGKNDDLPDRSDVAIVYHHSFLGKPGCWGSSQRT